MAKSVGHLLNANHQAEPGPTSLETGEEEKSQGKKSKMTHEELLEIGRQSGRSFRDLGGGIVIG
jgi:hypothetical protein